MAAKLKEFDQHAEGAVGDLTFWLIEHSEELIALARARHVIGHYLYDDRLMFEFDERRLKVEAAEEIADAINYLARRRQITAGDTLA